MYNARMESPMSTRYTQSNRHIRIDTPLATDELLLCGFSGTDSLSSMFHYTLKLLSENSALNFDSIVGKPVTITVDVPSHGKSADKKYINGIINSITQTRSTVLGSAQTPATFIEYSASLVPSLWISTQTSDCRIFQDLNIPDIVDIVFQDLGLTAYQWRIDRALYPKRNYCVQYRETSYNFISRLLESEGIYYFFEHSVDKHVMVLVDKNTEFKELESNSIVSFTDNDSSVRRLNSIFELYYGQTVTPGKYSVESYNFEMPLVDMSATFNGSDSRKLELYDYFLDQPFSSRDEVNRIARIRMESEEVLRVTLSGSSTCIGFEAGRIFTLTNHYRRELNRQYTIISVNHQIDYGSTFESTNVGTASEQVYSNTFICIPHPTNYRPARITPVPTIPGNQTAIVTGPKGEEIYVDRFGRVKIQFHWDRKGKMDEMSSAWVQVSQSMAGKRWGGMFIPRIGQEVIVGFMDGDPNHPIIVGSVYNGSTMPAYPLPEHQTRTSFRSNTSKGGNGFNEIRFEDKKGKEQLYLYAQKNYIKRIRNDSVAYIGSDKHLIVKRDQFEKVEGEKHLQVKGNQVEKIDGTVSLESSANILQKAGLNVAIDSGKEIHLKAGMSIVIESGLTLTLKVGANFITIDSAGVAIQGTMVLINSGGIAAMGSGCSPESPKEPETAGNP